MSIAVYWESWSSKDLTSLSPDVGIVYLAFSDPKTTYKAGQNTLDGTGLSFSQSFSTLKSQISTLKARGIKVMLSVGGATYPYPEPFNAKASVALMIDLGCDGCDIDWEPSNGISSAYQFGPIIAAFRVESDLMYLSAACWSVGAYGAKADDSYYGLNIPGMVSNGGQLSWINIMV